MSVVPEKPLAIEAFAVGHSNTAADPVSNRAGIVRLLAEIREDFRQLHSEAESVDNADNRITKLLESFERARRSFSDKTESISRILSSQVSVLPPPLPVTALVKYRAPEYFQFKTPRDETSEKSSATADRDEIKDSPSALVVDRHVLRDAQIAGSSGHREVVLHRFNVQLPTIKRRQRSADGNNDALVLVPTASTDASLSCDERPNTLVAPPHGVLRDAGGATGKQGGITPASTELLLDSNPLKRRLAVLHPLKERAETRGLSPMHEHSDVTSAKLDLRSWIHFKVAARGANVAGQAEAQLQRVAAAGQSEGKSVARRRAAPTPVCPPNSCMLSLSAASEPHTLVIQDGRLCQTKEYESYRETQTRWDAIGVVLCQLQQLLSEYSVPIAHVCGERLTQAALAWEACSEKRRIPAEELLSVVNNVDDVRQLVGDRRRRYVGVAGHAMAATKLQAAVRCFLARRRYGRHRQQQWAASVIALSWMTCVKMTRIKQQLTRARREQVDFFRHQAELLREAWPRVARAKRVIIHIPSIGALQNIRDTIDDFSVRQNMQVGRLAEISNPDVDVLYISPMEWDEYVTDYYRNMLSVPVDDGPYALLEGPADDITDEADYRFRIFVPEAVREFPNHRMCVASLLKYSPKTLRRIKSFIRGREAYIVPGVMHQDDLEIAEVLNVPILGTEPQVAQLYGSKSGARRIFQAAGAPCAPGMCDVYTSEELYDKLAHLIVNNLSVKRWLFKINMEIDGRGTAYCDVTSHLACDAWLRSEAARYGATWRQPWAQEAAVDRVRGELAAILESHARPVVESLYPTWRKFSEVLLGKGGVLEAYPPSDDVTNLTADVLVAPDGRVQLLVAGDQLHAESSLRCWGTSVPQCSVEPAELNSCCQRIGEACRKRRIVGYISIDFATFVDPASGEQRMWATDLDVGYSEHLANFELLRHLTGARLCTDTHTLSVEFRPPPSGRRVRRGRASKPPPPLVQQRYAVLSSRLHHSNLAVVHYSVFFQLCRANGMGFSTNDKRGTVLMLLDSFGREHLGMFTVANTLQRALSIFGRNLATLHREISSPEMQGETNFLLGARDIDAILGQTLENELDAANTQSEAVTNSY
ncbi:PREDICTED: IQ domain-containing protein H-like [Priapulus caudatus]|uniref:IQ domain-containing protein H-like n=1 Tax=Priapulus caudatus TaxID=37621 RepID=A0ABM1EKM8_PRICU|nr:PREDICTED: IQ domain-containing protein H-like [Priapulus caudatus]